MAAYRFVLISVRLVATTRLLSHAQVQILITLVDEGGQARPPAREHLRRLWLGVDHLQVILQLRKKLP